MTANSETHARDERLDGLDGGDATAAGLKQRLKERADELIDDGREALGNVGGKVSDQVRERPLTSLVVAGSVGLLLGLLIARKR